MSPLPSFVRIAPCLALLASVSSCARSSSQQPPPPKPPLEFVGEWGTRGDGPGQLKLPSALATDAYGSVYVADQESRFINKFDSNGRPLLAFELPGRSGAQSIAVDTGNAIYVGGSSRGISIFLPDGSHLRTLRRHHARPDALAVDPDGNIFSLCTSGTLQKLSPRGRSLGIWGNEQGSARQFISPSALALGGDGFLYVADRGNHRIQKFTSKGELAALWPLPAGEMGEPPTLVSLTTFRNFLFLLTLQQGQYTLSVWSAEGKAILADQLEGRLRHNGGSNPRITTSPKGELLVLDSSAARVLRFRINF